MLLQAQSLRNLKDIYCSGGRWSQKIHDIMLDMGFSPCKAGPCVWLRKAKCATKYEYVAIYVDDLLIACTCASEFIHTHKRKHNLKIKVDETFKVPSWMRLSPGPRWHPCCTAQNVHLQDPRLFPSDVLW